MLLPSLALRAQKPRTFKAIPYKPVADASGSDSNSCIFCRAISNNSCSGPLGHATIGYSRIRCRARSRLMKRRLVLFFVVALIMAAVVGLTLQPRPTLLVLDWAHKAP